MIRQELLFIINPKAGSDKRKSELENQILSVLNQSKFAPVFEYTAYKGHAKQLTASYLEKNFRLFVAVGGDGTVNEIASVLVKKSAALFIVPKGSGNGLARHLGIMLDLEESIKRLNRATEKRIDVGLANGLPFFCTCGLGFDAFCANLFDREAKRRGLLNYIRVALKAWFKYKGISVTYNEMPIHDLYNVTFGNANQFGNNAFICPKAILDDGFLDISIISKHAFYRIPGLIFRLFNGTIYDSNLCEYYRGKAFNVKSDKPLLLHLDGEPVQLDESELSIKVLEKSLIVLR